MIEKSHKFRMNIFLIFLIIAFINQSGSTNLILSKESPLLLQKVNQTNQDQNVSLNNLNQTQNGVVSLHLLKSFVYMIPLNLSAHASNDNQTNNSQINIALNNYHNSSLSQQLFNLVSNNRTNGSAAPVSIKTLFIFPLKLRNITEILKQQKQEVSGFFNNTHRPALAKNYHQNDTRFYFKIVSWLGGSQSIYQMKKNDSLDKNILLTIKLINLKQLIKHAILKYFSRNMNSLDVDITLDNSTVLSSPLVMPIYAKVLITKSPIKLEYQDVEKALIDYSINEKKCYLLTNRSDENNNSKVECNEIEKKDRDSLLRLGDLWIKLDSENEPIMEKITDEEMKVFGYQPAWIIGLIVLGCIMAVFFIGCIFAVCYTRRPYRRSSKVYEIESSKKNRSSKGPKQIPQIPGVNPPTTKPSSMKTRDREFYY